MNQLTTVGGVSAGHDARGNVTTDPSTGNSYGYSSENLLTSGTAGANSYSLTYDPLTRLASISGAPATGFGYDGLDMIDESQNGAIVAHHVFDPDTGLPLVTQYGTSSHLFLSPDERGSVMASTGDSGSLLYGNPYDEFGRPMPWSTYRYLYTGQAWINELGLSYYKARMYSPKLGRFLQTDPIRYADSPNLYAYVLNDPVNLVDPLGLLDLAPGYGWCGRSCAVTSDGRVVVTGNGTQGAAPALGGAGMGGGGGFGAGLRSVNENGEDGGTIFDCPIISNACLATQPSDPPAPQESEQQEQNQCGTASDLAESAKYVLDFTGTAADIAAVAVAGAGLIATPAPPLALGLETAGLVLKGISITANGASAGISFIQGNYYGFAGSAMAAVVGFKGDKAIEAYGKLYGKTINAGKAEIGATAASQALARGLVCPK